jgi:hypothetical protein
MAEKTPAVVTHDPQGNLTRAGMEQVLREGGSVLHKGQVIGRAEALPTEADLAAGDEQATAKALEGLKAQRDALDAQEKKLLASRGESAKAREQAQEQQAAAEKHAARTHTKAGDADDDAEKSARAPRR